jgi:oligopeptide/dipeptide ABC transporter ATP-binding protein
MQSSKDWSMDILTPQTTPLLEVSALHTSFNTDEGLVRAVDGVDFHIQKGEILGIVGESGCGKSVTALSIMRLIRPPGKIDSGDIKFQGHSLLAYTEEEMRQLRGEQISMIFQQPQTALNPVFDVGNQIGEVLNIHQDFGKEAGYKRATELLKMVGIPDAERRVEAYPHELSGGMAQRVMIAMALACLPELLIADEPTTALDVTIQAQILDLIIGLRNRLETAVILITHDLGVVAETADRVAVMYAGQIVEEAKVRELFNHPKHPYTQGLIASIPVLGERRDRLDVIPGIVPNLIDLPPGCRFAPRCRVREQQNLTVCTQKEPILTTSQTGHKVRCFAAQDQLN